MTGQGKMRIVSRFTAAVLGAVLVTPALAFADGITVGAGSADRLLEVVIGALLVQAVGFLGGLLYFVIVGRRFLTKEYPAAMQAVSEQIGSLAAKIDTLATQMHHSEVTMAGEFRGLADLQRRVTALEQQLLEIGRR